MGAIDLSALSAPSPLSAEHRLDEFICKEEPTLEAWLKERARKNESSEASRTYVVSARGAVVGYYCLSAGAVSHEGAASNIRRNMPDPIPVIVLGRLAVHSDWTGHGIGPGLLKDAVLRSISVAETLGVRAMLCHALSPRAKAFYIKYGFIESPLDPMTLMLNISKLASRDPA